MVSPGPRMSAVSVFQQKLESTAHNSAARRPFSVANDTMPQASYVMK